MVTLLLGTDWVANRDKLLQMMAKDVSEELQGSVLIVPELISHDTERRLCMAAGDTVSRFAEVLTFSRLARAVADEIGIPVEPCLDEGGRIVAMAAAVRQLHSKLKSYASLETKPEFLTGLIEAVDEFKRCCITSSDLMAASKKTTGSFAQKLEELSLILDCYDGLCQHGKCDPREQMSWLLEKLETSAYAKNHVFYIDGFPDFTKQHMEIVNHLIRESRHVVISLNCDGLDSTQMAFEKSADTAAEILRFAKRSGVDINILNVNSDAHPMLLLRDRLFQGKLHSIDSGLLSVHKADSIYHECLAAAEYITQKVQSGARYRDIAVVYTDAGVYRNTLEMVFSRCNIPVYLSGTEQILDKSVIATVIAAVDTALGGFDTSDVLRYLKSVLSPVSDHISDQIENYVRLWGINGSGWLAEWTANPQGLVDQWSDSAKDELSVINQARKDALAPLAMLRDRFRNAANIGEQIQALYLFFGEIALEKRLDALARELDSAGDNRSAQILDQLWDILINALEQLYDVLGATVWDTDVFVRLFKLLLSQYDVGTIPPVLDAVTAGPVSAMRCQQSHHLVVLGASEGSLPGYAGFSGVLTDRERTELREMGIPLAGGAMEGLQTEFAEIYGVFCGAQSSVYVSYTGAQPSFVCRRLHDMAGGEIACAVKMDAAFADPIEASAYLVKHDAWQAAESIGILENYQNIKRCTEYTIGTVSNENIRGLYGDTLNLSASQVDKLADCRCHYFLRYGLRANEQKPISVDPAEFGTYVHAVLENTAREICKMGGFSAVTEAEVLSVAKRFSQEYAQVRFAQIDTKRSNYLFHRNYHELELIAKELWAELHEIAFVPVGFEVSFGNECDMPAIDCSGSRLGAQLRGFVDRVDRWTENDKDYFRVVDYKTGRKDFDYCDIFNGLGLQMLLYLFALEQEGNAFFNGNPVPAGVQYFPARVPLVNADGKLTDEEADAVRAKNWKRKGLLLLDPAALSAMETPSNIHRMPYTVRKDGTFSGDLADSRQFKQLKKYVFKLLKRMVDDVASGNVTPNPYTRGASHNACAFCPYGTVCHKNYVTDRRNYQAMPAQRFWEEIEKEVTDNNG